jgi:hypothetical protein
MAPKNETKDVELKVRIPKDLMTRIKDFWHEQKLDCRKEAVVILLEQGLSNGKVPKRAEKPKTE